MTHVSDVAPPIKATRCNRHVSTRDDPARTPRTSAIVTRSIASSTRPMGIDDGARDDAARS